MHKRMECNARATKKRVLVHERAFVDVVRKAETTEREVTLTAYARVPRYCATLALDSAVYVSEALRLLYTH